MDSRILWNDGQSTGIAAIDENTSWNKTMKISNWKIKKVIITIITSLEQSKKNKKNLKKKKKIKKKLHRTNLMKNKEFVLCKKKKK
jgi:hypothetical protein